MDEREIESVSLGAVLNRDDSWVHLIDEPTVSDFLRDWETDTSSPIQSRR